MDFLKKKYFGLPVWAYAVVAVILIGAIWYYIHKQNSSSSTSTPAVDTSSPASTSTPLVPNAGSGSSPGFPSSDFRRAAGNTTTTTPTPTTPAGSPIINLNPTIELPSPSNNPNPSPGTVAPLSPSASLGQSANQLLAGSGLHAGSPVIVPIGNSGESLDVADLSALTNPADLNLPLVNLPLKQPTSTKTVPTSNPSIDKNGNTVTTTKTQTKPQANAYTSPATSTHIH